MSGIRVFLQEKKEIWVGLEELDRAPVGLQVY